MFSKYKYTGPKSTQSTLMWQPCDLHFLDPKSNLVTLLNSYSYWVMDRQLVSLYLCCGSIIYVLFQLT